MTTRAWTRALPLLLIASPSLAASWVVDGSGGADFSRIQDAIDDASDGDTITVNDGTYYEAIDFSGKALHIVSASGPAATTIDALEFEESAVTLAGGEGPGTSLEGFTILNGGDRGLYLVGSDASFITLVLEDLGDGGAHSGAGAWIDGGSPTFEGVLFTDNEAGRGTVYVTGGATPTFIDTEFTGNEALTGGGIYLDDGALALSGCSFLENEAYDYGGAIYVADEQTLDSDDTRYEGNEVTSYGGAIYAGIDATLDIAGGAMVDNQVLFNTSSYSYDLGGAIYLYAGVTLDLSGVEFSGNLAGQGGAIYAQSSPMITSSDNVFQDQYAYQGGALYLGRDAVLDDVGSVFSGNEAYHQGGAFYFNQGGALSFDGTGFNSNGATSEGGVFYLVNRSSLSLTDNTFTENASTDGYGGVLYSNMENDVAISGGVFEDNSADSGGALFLRDASTLSIEGSSFTGNSVSGSGGACYLNNLEADTYGPTRITDTTFEANLSEGFVGGAIYAAYDSDIEAVGVDFIGNYASASAGAVASYYETGLDLESVSFVDNSSDYGAGALSIDFGYDPIVIRDSLFEGNSSHQSYGGAIAAYSDTHLELQGVVLRDNFAYGSGGALYLTGSAEVRIEDSTLDHNESIGSGGGSYGGALFNSDAEVLVLSGNRFCANTADYGGAVYSSDTNSGGADLWTNNTFQENQAYYDGGALHLTSHYYSELFNNTFVGNQAFGNGGAALLAGSHAYIGGAFVNNIIASTAGGDGVHVDDTTATFFPSYADYNAWYDNTSADVGGALSAFPGAHSLSADPMFSDYTDDGDCENDALTPAAGSPLIDAGDPGLLDPDGSTSDLGASGGPEANVFDADEDGFYAPGDDCDDSDADINPDAEEADDGVDNDCDDSVDEGFEDTDDTGDTDEPGDTDTTDGTDAPDDTDTPDDTTGDGEDTDAPSSGGGGDDGGEDKSGCSTAGSAPPEALLWLVCLVGLARRRSTAG